MTEPLYLSPMRPDGRYNINQADRCVLVDLSKSTAEWIVENFNALVEINLAQSNVVKEAKELIRQVNEGEDASYQTEVLDKALENLFSHKDWCYGN